MNNAEELLPDGLVLAPVWRRALAVLINLLVVIAGIVAVGAGVFGAVKLGLTRRLAPARGLLTRRLAALRRALDPSHSETDAVRRKHDCSCRSRASPWSLMDEIGAASAPV